MNAVPEMNAASIATTVCGLIRNRPDVRIGLWGVIGLGERIVDTCPQMKDNLVWLGDRNPALLGAQIAITSLPISTTASLGLADLDVLVLGVRHDVVDEVIAVSTRGLKNGTTIVSLKGVHVVVQNSYEGAAPLATYSPWNIDCAFQSVYAEVMSSTLVDKYRCHELWQLVEQSAKFGAGALLEVGVWKGGTGALIAKRAALSGVADPTILCDTFKGVVKACEFDSTYRGGEHQDCTRGDVVALMERLGIDNYRILEGIFPEETGGQISKLQFRFCHVDVDVYESARDVIQWLWPRLIEGGIVVFDDYGFQSCDGVTAFVNEMRQYPDCIVIHNLNGHANAIKLSAAQP